MEWRSDEIHRTRLEFEFQHGDRDSAIAYYETLRDEGVAADLFLHKRVKLALRFPGAPWHVRDAVGLGMILALVLLMSAMPAFFLIPVHYVGLIRSRRSPGCAPLDTRWKLRQAWWVIATCIIAGVPFMFMDGVYIVEEFVGAFAGVDSTQAGDWPEIPDTSLAAGGVSSIALMGLGLIAVVRRSDLPRFGRGEWTWKGTIGSAFVALVLARIVFGALYVALPESMRDGTTSTVGLTGDLIPSDVIIAIAKIYGVPFMFLLIAVAVPVVEEVAFRSVILDGMRRHLSFGWANVMQATVFASLHEATAYFPFFLVMGLLAGSLARRSGGLLAPILLHAGNNTLACAQIVRSLS